MLLVESSLLKYTGSRKRDAVPVCFASFISSEMIFFVLHDVLVRIVVQMYCMLPSACRLVVCGGMEVL